MSKTHSYDYAIGVDLGGTKILAGTVELATGKIVNSVKHKTTGGKETLLERVEAAVSETVAALPPGASVAGIGVGVAGQVDRQNGVILAAPNLDVPNNFPMAVNLTSKFSLPTRLGNDVEVATLGELNFGSGRDVPNFICIFVGTGIGGGIVLGGVPFAGQTGTAGEVGHMIVSADGRYCGCGGRGHLEAYSSRTAITRTLLGELKRGRASVLRELLDMNEVPDANKASSIAIRSKMIAKAVAANDELTLEVLQEAATFLGLGLASVINLLNPQRIVLGGGLIEAVDVFYNQVVKIAKREALTTPAAKVEIVKTALGDFSGLVGAALLTTH